MKAYKRLTEQNGMLDCMHQCGNWSSCIGCVGNVPKAIERWALRENARLVELIYRRVLTRMAQENEIDLEPYITTVLFEEQTRVLRFGSKK